MKKVLLIDDNLTILHFIKKIIHSNFNCDIKELSESVNSISIIKEYQPDLIILDIIMPELDGLEVINYLLDENIKIPIIISTSLDNFVNQIIYNEYKDKGYIYDYILKPFSEESFCQLIKPLIENCQD